MNMQRQQEETTPSRGLPARLLSGLHQYQDSTRISLPGDKLTLGLNYDSKLKCLNRVIALWKQRDLTPLGKVTIMKTFGFSQFVYVSSIIGMPDAVQKKINAAKFIWNGTDKIKRAVLNSNYCDGGLKMINLKARIRTQKLT